MTSLNLPALPHAIVDNEALAQQITLLAGQLNAATHRLLRMIAEFDRRKAWSGGGTVRSCAHWLNWQCGIALGAAREKVRVSHCLELLPHTDAAFAAGEISYSKVRAMTRVATAQNEDFLLMIARHGTASHLERVVRKYRNVQAREARVREAVEQNRRALVYYQDDQDMWVIHARLPREEGAAVVKAIEAVAKPELEKRQKAQREENVSAETFPALLAHTRADALAKIAEHFLATEGGTEELRSLKGSERCQVVLHVGLDTLRRHIDETRPTGDCCHGEDNRWLSPATARRLACNASLVTVLEDEKGKVLNIGRKSRTVPTHIDRALRLRDPTCRFPGCCESRYIDAHHVQHWADGGETSLDNLVTLCRYHHRLLHSGGFGVAMIEGEPMFTTPGGTRIEPHISIPRVSAETSARAIAGINPHVTPTTAVTKWRGEDCDYEMCIDALLARDAQTSSPS